MRPPGKRPRISLCADLQCRQPTSNIPRARLVILMFNRLEICRLFRTIRPRSFGSHSSCEFTTWTSCRLTGAPLLLAPRLALGSPGKRNFSERTRTNFGQRPNDQSHSGSDSLGRQGRQCPNANRRMPAERKRKETQPKCSDSLSESRQQDSRKFRDCLWDPFGGRKAERGGR